MGGRLKTALEEGLILGVKFGTALFVMLFISGWFLNDYRIIRTQAAHGENAFQFILQEQANAEAREQDTGP